MTVERAELERRLPKKPQKAFDELFPGNEMVKELIVSMQDRQALVALSDGLLFLRWTMNAAAKVALFPLVPLPVLPGLSMGASAILVAGRMAGTHKNGTGHLKLSYSKVSDVVVHQMSTGVIIEAQSPGLNPVSARMGTWTVTGRPNHWNAMFVSKKELRPQLDAISRIQKLVLSVSLDAVPTLVRLEDGKEATTTTVPPPDLADQLERLVRLKDAGGLTAEEFALAKSALLEGGSVDSANRSPSVSPPVHRGGAVVDVGDSDEREPLIQALQDRLMTTEGLEPLRGIERDSPPGANLENTFLGAPKENGYEAGWYPDIFGEDLRWWDGDRWAFEGRARRI